MASDKSALPVTLDLYLVAGDNFTYSAEYQLNGERVDLTGYEVEWTFFVHNQYVVATGGNGKIVVTDNVINLSLSTSDTASLVGAGRHWLRISKTGVRKTLIVGDVILSE